MRKGWKEGREERKKLYLDMLCSQQMLIFFFYFFDPEVPGKSAIMP